MRVLVIDNYDSFTYNLVQYVGSLGVEIEVFRNDEIDAAGARARRPDAVIVSPGPCTPAEAGASVEIIRALGPEVPILGVCLGHQAIAAAYGGVIRRAERVVHGKASEIYHEGTGLFAGLPSPLIGGRYHSLIVERETLPADLAACAWTVDGTIMALRHRRFPTFGLQFHPESVLTPDGPAILERFLQLARREAA